LHGGGARRDQGIKSHLGAGRSVDTVGLPNAMYSKILSGEPISL
jgi:hypothetical protein